MVFAARHRAIATARNEHPGLPLAPAIAMTLPLKAELPLPSPGQLSISHPLCRPRRRRPP